MKVLKIFIALTFLSTSILGQSPNDDLEISILTCSAGSELYSIFGHSAIRVKNYSNGEDFVYDYGVFDANEPNFLVKFLNGNLKYRLEETAFSEFIYYYQTENRGVVEEVLNLSYQDKLRVSSLLIENLKPENRYYYYDFFFDNCATRIKNIIEQIKSVSYKGVSSEMTNKTFRENLHIYLNQKPWIKFGIDILLGQSADKEMTFKEEMFLPIFLSENLKAYSINNQNSLIKNSTEILPQQFISNTTIALPYSILYGMLVLVILLVWYLPKYASGLTNILNLLLGFVGLFLLYMWIFSSHQTSQNNWNLIWLNPLYLLLLFRQNTKFIRISVLSINLICLIFFSIIPQNLNALAIPIIIAMTILNARTIIKNGI